MLYIQPVPPLTLKDYPKTIVIANSETHSENIFWSEGCLWRRGELKIHYFAETSCILTIFAKSTPNIILGRHILQWGFSFGSLENFARKITKLPVCYLNYLCHFSTRLKLVGIKWNWNYLCTTAFSFVGVYRLFIIVCWTFSSLITNNLTPPATVLSFLTLFSRKFSPKLE